MTEQSGSLAAQVAEDAFHLWVSVDGDREQVARLMHVSPEQVQLWKTDFAWTRRLRELIGVPAGELEQDDFRRAVIELNRAVNYAQAHRLRTVCERALLELTGKESVLDALSVTNAKTGATSYDLGQLKLLAGAIETAQALSAKALGDRGGKSVGAGRQGMLPSTGRAALAIGAAFDAATGNPVK